MSDTATEEPRHRGRALLLPIAVAAVGLAAIAILEDAPTRHGVETNLTSRSAHALADAGLTGVHVTFAGRDGTIYAPTADDGRRALVIVANLNGVRTANVIVAGQPLTGSGQPGTPVPTPSPSVTLSVAPTPSPSPSSVPGSPAPTSSPTAPVTADNVQAQIDALTHIEFATGSAALTPASRSTVAKVAAILQANPTVRVRIEGNTDSVGSTSMNLALSRARATSVYTALRALGIARGRMTIVGYGESRPKVPNTSAANRAVNRRVDIAVVA